MMYKCVSNGCARIPPVHHPSGDGYLHTYLYILIRRYQYLDTVCKMEDPTPCFSNFSHIMY